MILLFFFYFFDWLLWTRKGKLMKTINVRTMTWLCVRRRLQRLRFKHPKIQSLTRVVLFSIHAHRCVWRKSFKQQNTTVCGGSLKNVHCENNCSWSLQIGHQFLWVIFCFRLFGNTGYCAACNKVIPAFEMVMRARSNVYHLECFACQQCNHRLVYSYNFITSLPNTTERI